VEIQNLIISIFPILTNVRDNFVHFRLSNVIQILSNYRPNFAATPIFVDGSTLTDESLINYYNKIIPFFHDISYSIAICITISSHLYIQ